MNPLFFWSRKVVAIFLIFFFIFSLFDFVLFNGNIVSAESKVIPHEQDSRDQEIQQFSNDELKKVSEEVILDRAFSLNDALQELKAHPNEPYYAKLEFFQPVLYSELPNFLEGYNLTVRGFQHRFGENVNWYPKRSYQTVEDALNEFYKHRLKMLKKTIARFDKKLQQEDQSLTTKLDRASRDDFQGQLSSIEKNGFSITEIDVTGEAEEFEKFTNEIPHMFSFSNVTCLACGKNTESIYAELRDIHAIQSVVSDNQPQTLATDETVGESFLNYDWTPDVGRVEYVDNEEITTRMAWLENNFNPIDHTYENDIWIDNKNFMKCDKETTKWILVEYWTDCDAPFSSKLPHAYIDTRFDDDDPFLENFGIGGWNLDDELKTYNADDNDTWYYATLFIETEDTSIESTTARYAPQLGHWADKNGDGYFARQLCTSHDSWLLSESQACVTSSESVLIQSQGIPLQIHHVGNDTEPILESVSWDISKQRFMNLNIVDDSVQFVNKGNGNYDLNFQIQNLSTFDENRDIIIEYSINPANVQSGKDVGFAYIYDKGLRSGETSPILTFSLNNFSYSGSGSLGSLIIISPELKNYFLDNYVYRIDDSDVENVVDPSGVDFSDISIAGIDINPDTGSIDFILNAISGNGADASVSRETAREIFMTALAIPNWKQWISLPLGGVEIQAPFEQTELSRVMLRADVQMKFDLFHPNVTNIGSLTDQWVSMVKQSPYWSILKTYGFNELPSWRARGTIIPGDISVNAEENRIFLNDADLSLQTIVEWVNVDVSKYNFGSSDAAVKASLQTLLETWKTLLAEKLTSLEPSISEKFRTDSRYRELREIYPIVALAHWYKTLSKENLPYADFIDSENIADLQADAVFDEAYWKSQSDQYISDYYVHDFYGNTQTWNVHGGVELTVADPEVDQELSNDQKEVLTNVLDSYSSENTQTPGEYYLYGGSMTVPYGDASGTLDIDSDAVVPGKPLEINVQIANLGSESIESSFVYDLMVKIENEQGTITEYSIASGNVSRLDGWGTLNATHSWTLPTIFGQYEFILKIDPDGKLSETWTGNNSFSVKVDANMASPKAVIYWPSEGMLMSATDSTFYGGIEDEKDKVLSDDHYSWYLDNATFVGNGDTVTIPQIASGLHTMTLNVKDSDDLTASTIIHFSVPDSGPPVLQVLSPVENQIFPSEKAIIFSAEAIDYEDDYLGFGNIVWTTDNGSTGGMEEIGTGDYLSVDTLRIGHHNITVTATDSDGNSVSDMVYIVVEEGPPVLLLINPDKTDFFEDEQIPFQAQANDRQDGNINAKIEWYSSRDGFIGTGGGLFSKNLSVGAHTLTVSVMDSDGQKATVEKTINVSFRAPSTVTILAPLDGSTVSYNEAVTFSGSASDVKDGLLSGDHLIWESDRNGFLGTGETFNVNWLVPGDHVITLRASDSDHAETTSSIHLMVDAGQPRVTVNFPTQGSELFYGYAYDFNGSAVDEMDGDMTGANLVWTSNLNGIIGTGKTPHVIGLSQGNQRIALQATDSDGWVGEAFMDVKVIGPHAPELSLVKPSDGFQMVHGGTLSFKANVSDYEDSRRGYATRVNWYVDGQALASGSTYEISTTDGRFGIGNHVIMVEAIDELNAKTQIASNIQILNSPPTVEITSPTSSDNIFVQGKDTVALRGTGSDLEDGILSGNSLVWTSNLNGELGRGVSIDVSAVNLNVGTHTVTLTGHDNSGAESEAEVNIIIVKTGVGFINTFDNGNTEKVLDFTAGGSKEKLYLKIPSNAFIEHAQVNFQGEQTFGINLSGGNYFLGTSYSAIAFADIDSDFDKDLFVGNVDGTLSFYRNDGNIVAPLWHYVSNPYSQYDVGWYARPYLVDIDGDFDYDLFLGESNGAGKIRFYKNVGTRTEPEWNYVTDNFANVDMGGVGIHPVFVDIDGDSDSDLFASPYDTVYFYENNNGFFEFITSQYADAYVSASAAPVFVDIDNDNDYDLFIGTGDGTVEFYKNIGNSTSPSWQLIDEKYMNIDIDTMASSLVDEGAAPSFVDIDGDNDYDLFIGEGAGNINYFENKGNGKNPNFELKTEYYLFDVGNSSKPTLTDIDSDNDQDLFIGEKYGYIRYFRNDGSQSAPAWTFVTNNYGNIDLGPYYNTSPSPTFADIDGDSDQDFFIGLSDGRIDFYRNIGNRYNATWQLAEENYKGIDLGNDPSHPYFVDIDTDGDLDLFTTKDGLIYFYENIGTKANAEWLSPSTYILATGAQADPAFYDIDGDLDYDILVGNKDGTILSYLNNGNLSHFSFVQDNIYYGSIDIGYESSPYIVNIDGDSYGEIFIGNKDGGLSLYDATGPRNPSLDVGDDVDNEWMYLGEFITSESTVNFADSINDYLEYFLSGADTSIPLIIHSQSAGRLRVNNVNIQYNTIDSEPPIFGTGTSMNFVSGISQTTSSTLASPNPVYAGQNLTINANVTDNHGIASVTANFAGNNYSMTANGPTWSINFQAPTQTGRYTLTLTALDTSGISASISEEVDVRASGQDLAVIADEISMSNKNPDEGQTVTAHVTVHNFGDQTASGDIAIYAGDIQISETDRILTVSPLGSWSGDINFTAQIDMTSINVLADWRKNLSEYDETNNSAQIAFEVRDISPPSLQNMTFPEEVSVGSTNTMMIDVTDNTAITEINMFIDGQEFPLNFISGNKYSRNFLITTSGEKVLEVMATNAQGLSSTVNGVLHVYPQEPDLVFQSGDLVLSTNEPAAGETVGIDVTYRNEGYKKSPDTKLVCSVNGMPKSDFTIQPNSGEIQTVHFEWMAELGSHSLECILDPDSRVTETKENNNTLSTVISVNSADIPRIDTLEIQENIVEGEAFLIQIGLAPAVSFTRLQTVGQENVRVQTQYETSILTYDPNDGLYHGSLQYPLNGDEYIEVYAESAAGISHAVRQSVLVRPDIVDIDVNDKEMVFSDTVPSLGDSLNTSVTLKNPGGKEGVKVPVHFVVEKSAQGLKKVAQFFGADNPIVFEDFKTVDINAGQEIPLSFTWLPDVPGDYSLRLEVDPDGTLPEFDENNNTATRSLKVVDTTSPQIYTVQHTENPYEQGNLDVQVYAVDNVAVSTVSAFFGENTILLDFNEETSMYEGNIFLQSSGVQTLSIVATDSSGLNSSVLTKKIMIYALPPDLFVNGYEVEMVGGIAVEGKSLTFEVPIENHGGSDALNFSVDFLVDGVEQNALNIPQLLKGETTKAEFSFVSSFGQHSFEIRVDSEEKIVESNEQNNNFIGEFFAVDTTPPTSPNPVASPSSWTSENNFTITWNEVTDSQGIKDYSYSIDGGSFASVGSEKSVFLENRMTEGVHTIAVKASDTQGNISDARQVSIYYDSNPPVVPTVKEVASGNTWTNQNVPQYVWSAAMDEGSGVVSYRGRIDEGEAFDMGNVLNFRPNPLSEGVHTFQASAIDAVSKQSDWSKNVTVMIDISDPVAPIISSSTHYAYNDGEPDEGQAGVNNNTPEFQWQIPEDISGIAGYYYIFTSNPDELPDQYSFWISAQDDVGTPITNKIIDTLPSLNDPQGKRIFDGIWYFRMIAKDNVGHISNIPSTYAIKIDVIEPLLIPYNPLPAHETSNVETSTSFAWNMKNSCELIKGNMTFTLYLGESSDTLSQFATLSNHTCDETRIIFQPEMPLIRNKEYFWQIETVTEIDGQPVNEKSDIWTFRTKIRPTPVDVLDPKFNWKFLKR
ncbi:VCBS repeat-containing protein [Candidatus Peregrinibacteria bacterium]|nr:VCBS repeat-containing protein [Candidatus Peregrinibacteria bacterium]